MSYFTQCSSKPFFPFWLNCKEQFFPALPGGFLIADIQNVKHFISFPQQSLREEVS